MHPKNHLILAVPLRMGYALVCLAHRLSLYGHSSCHQVETILPQNSKLSSPLVENQGLSPEASVTILLAVSSGVPFAIRHALRNTGADS